VGGVEWRRRRRRRRRKRMDVVCGERERGRERKGVLIRKVRRHSKKKREEKRSAVDSHFSIIFSLSLSSLRACCCVSTAEEAFARLCVRVSSL
jgi:hypothetical protein